MKKTIHSEQGVLIRDALRQVREKAGLTQRELCRILGKEHTFISKCELGERRIDIAEFYWICKACEASPRKEVEKLIKAFDKL
ncbi:MAG: helix-turn-helix transcriptional regulator [Ectothiorhodospiraceae bacterium]|nr:helix-turn-helix transcriptional regulator [Ectothiorhodospiraceae bacterium]